MPIQAPAEADPPSEGLNHSSETLPDRGPRDVGPGGSSSVETSSSANSGPIEATAGVRPPMASQPTTGRAPAMAEKPRSPERNYQAEALNRGPRVVGPGEHSGVVANCSAIDNGQQIKHDAQHTRANREGAGKTGNEAPDEAMTLQNAIKRRCTAEHAPAAATTAMRQTGYHDRARAREEQR
jgi:hypothetical protein